MRTIYPSQTSPVGLQWVYCRYQEGLDWLVDFSYIGTSVNSMDQLLTCFLSCKEAQQFCSYMLSVSVQFLLAL